MRGYPVSMSWLWAASLALFGLWSPDSRAEVTTSINRDRSQITLQIRVDDIVFDEVTIADQKFLKPRLVDVEGHEGVLYQIGQPELPVLRFILPGNPQVQVIPEPAAITLGPLNIPIKPAQESLPKLADAVRSFVMDQDSYQSTQVKPQQRYDIQPAGSLNGIPQSLVTLYPIRYAPAGGHYQLQRRFTITYQDQPKTFLEGKRRFVFIVGQKFAGSPSLQRYAKLKEDLGFVVNHLVVAPKDSPSMVRQRLMSLYKQRDASLAYALIIGDADTVPGYSGGVVRGITDHFYRSLDIPDYAADINGPDIGLGRVAVQTEAQLDAVLTKFTRYIRGDFQSNDWLKSMSFVATDDQWEIAEATHDYAIKTYTEGRGYTGIFPNAEQKGGDQLYAVSHQVPDAKVHEIMDAGRTIINYSGHGDRTGWMGPHVDPSHVRSLNHPSALPFVVANACITGDFRTSESFGETWQRHPQGAIAYWGSMDNTFWDEDDILERRMYDGIFKERRRTFADITHHALRATWQHYGGAGKSRYYWETYVLFGDPSIELRTLGALDP